MSTRRSFVGEAVQAMAGLAVMPPWRLWGSVPGTLIRHGISASELIKNVLPFLDLPGLAQAALDAATQAGASFADIRLGEHYELRTPSADLDARFGYGIRVIVDGATAFIHGCFPDADRLVTAAREAVATARGYAKIQTVPVELAQALVVQGTWETPMRGGDPFVIPLRDQLDLTQALGDLRERLVPTGSAASDNELLQFSGSGISWTREHRVYASSAGSLITQTLHRGWPSNTAASQRTLFQRFLSQRLPHASVPRSGGYEILTDLIKQLPEIEAAMVMAETYSRLPVRNFDVGRFPVVVDGMTMGALLGGTISTALELDRALGYEAGAAGSSFLAPPDEILGHRVINPLLHVIADRAMPHYAAVKWDDEGVEPEAYPVLADGVVVDYHTSRETAPALANWYRARQQLVRSHGCAVSEDVSDPVTIASPHLTVAPARSAALVEDLCQGISRGLLVTQDDWITVDQQLTSGFLSPFEAFEVVRGKIVGRVKNVSIQFQTLPFWKTLVVLGDERTMWDGRYEVSKGIPWKRTAHTISAPAGLFKEVNVTQTGRAWG